MAGGFLRVCRLVRSVCRSGRGDAAGQQGAARRCPLVKRHSARTRHDLAGSGAARVPRPLEAKQRKHLTRNAGSPESPQFTPKFDYLPAKH